MKNFNDLKQNYLEILSTLDYSFFDKNNIDTKFHNENGLSGVFLPSEPDSYWTAKNKIMIIGAETRTWDVLGESQFTTLEKYIELSINKQKKFFDKQLALPKSKKITFHDFTRSIGEKAGKDGLVYCNLFCFSWKNKSPIGSKYFKQIHSISNQLLKAQLEYFQPEILIFANGMSSVKYRREIFPLSKCVTKTIDNEEITKHHLWRFNFNSQYLCYRVHHPSTISGRKLAKDARNKMIELLPEK